jgi:integrase
MKNVKSFLSGTFSYARRQGVLHGVNPMWDTELPECREGEDTCTYSLEEIPTMLDKVPEPASTMIAVGGFAALRVGEIRALEIEHFDGEQLWVKQSAWRSQLKNTKTRASKAPIPVIAPLRSRLEAHIASLSPRTSGLLFPNGLISRLTCNGWSKTSFDLRSKAQAWTGTGGTLCAADSRQTCMDWEFRTR